MIQDNRSEPSFWIERIASYEARTRRENATSAYLCPIIVELTIQFPSANDHRFYRKTVTDVCCLVRIFLRSSPKSFEPPRGRRERPLEATGCRPCDAITARLQPMQRAPPLRQWDNGYFSRVIFIDASPSRPRERIGLVRASISATSPNLKSSSGRRAAASDSL